MPDPLTPPDDEVVRLVQAYVRPLRDQAPPAHLQDSLIQLIRARHRRTSVGRWVGSVAVIAAVAVVAGIATAVHLGLLGGSGSPVGSGPGDWQAVSLPSGFSATGISCVGRDDCWLLGTHGTDAASAIWQYSGGAWTSVPFAGPGTLDGLTCVTADDCWAVGGHFTVTPGPNDGVTQPLIEHSDGTGFSAVSEPQVPGDADGLRAVSCVSADDCWADGNYGANSENGGDGILHPLVEHYDGSVWTVVNGAASGLDGAELTAVTCASPAECWAVGSQWTGALIEEFDGSGWRVVSSPVLNGIGLAAVACPSPADCWAAGSTGAPQTPTAPLEAPLIAQSAGAGWEVASSPSVQGGPNGAVLSGIACSSGDDCWAVGTIQEALSDLMGTPPPNTAPPLIEHWDGSSWTVVGGLPVDTGGGGLSDVTCVPASGDCFAVGPTSSTPSPVVERTPRPHPYCTAFGTTLRLR